MLKNIRFSARTIPLALLLLTSIAYGLLIPWIGFYWDDWPFAFLSHFFGPAEFFPAFKPFRPFLGPIFLATTTFLRESTLGWQIFGILIRFLTGLAAWWTFGKVWPAQPKQVLAVSLFFLIFPGYTQQWVSYTHTNQELIPLLFYLLSLGVMVWAYQRRSSFWPLTLLALFLAFWGLFGTEYTFGLEILRPLILWFLWEKTPLPVRQRLTQVAKAWAPYLLLWIVNAIWLVFYHRSGSYDSYGMKAFDFSGMGVSQIVLKILSDLIQAVSLAGFSAWSQTLQIITQPFTALSSFLVIGMVMVSFALIFYYLYRLNLSTDGSSASSRWAVQAMILGIIGILAGRLPSWAAGLPASLQFPWDRFMISMMLGGSLFFIGLIDFLVKNDTRKTVLISLFLALAIGQQFNNANTYRREWANQQKFFWQLTWRAPGIQPNTLLITHDLPFSYVSDFSLSAPLNWIYAPDLKTHDMPYMLAFTKIRLKSSMLPSLEPGQVIQYPYRTLTFKGSTSDSLVIYQPAPGCLRVMDPEFSNKETAPGAIYMLTDAIPLSNLSRIVPTAQPAIPPAAWFGNEPAHTWCYSFEKAELARQQGDWQGVVDLWHESQAKGFNAENPWELLPFTEALARTGDLETAQRLTNQVSEASPDLNPALCQLWQRVRDNSTNLAVSQKDQISSLRSALKCVP